MGMTSTFPSVGAALPADTEAPIEPRWQQTKRIRLGQEGPIGIARKTKCPKRQHVINRIITC